MVKNEDFSFVNCSDRVFRFVLMSIYYIVHIVSDNTTAYYLHVRWGPILNKTVPWLLSQGNRSIHENSL